MTDLVLQPSIRPEPPPQSVVAWQISYPLASGHWQTYSYSAVHVEGLGWFTSSRQWPNPITWAALCWLLGDTPIYVASSWLELPMVRAG